MHQRLTPAEIAALDVPAPFKPPAMTRAEKLERWATLLEAHLQIRLGDQIEHRADRDTRTWSYSPMAVAFDDQALKDAGLKDASYGEAKRFFELSDAQAHTLSCNCGGSLTGRDIASRVRSFVDYAPVPVPTPPVRDSLTPVVLGAAFCLVQAGGIALSAWLIIKAMS